MKKNIEKFLGKFDGQSNPHLLEKLRVGGVFLPLRDGMALMNIGRVSVGICLYNK